MSSNPISYSPNHYLILGSPGSGKGTYCQYLKKQGVYIIRPETILHREARINTELGYRFNACLQRKG